MMDVMLNNSSVTITEEAFRCISEFALRALPDECCGVLVGRDGTHAAIDVAWELPNRSARFRSRLFEVDPKELYAHTVRARSLQLDIVGFFHSHPDGAATPSSCDVRNGSGWPGYVNAIYAFAPGSERQRLRFYRTQPTCWREIPLKDVNP